MRLVSWNVNGIRAVERKGLFAPFLEATAPDVFCLQEVKAQASDHSLDLPSFELHWNAALRKGYAGTALGTKTPLLGLSTDLPKEITQRFSLVDDFGDANQEGRVLTATYEHFFLVTVYTPNAKGDLSRLELRHQHWDPAFLTYVTELEKIKPVIICGDLNVAHRPEDLANPKSNEGSAGYTPQERAGFEALLNAGFIDTFRLFTKGPGHYSWWSLRSSSREKNVGWRIDYFLVSAALRDAIQDARIHPEVLGSDHCPVSLTLDL